MKGAVEMPEELNALKVEVARFTGRVESRLDDISGQLSDISKGMESFVPRREHDRDQVDLNRRLANIEGDLRWLWRTMLTGGLGTIGAIIGMAKGWFG
jgi:hypothetical protein